MGVESAQSTSSRALRRLRACHPPVTATDLRHLWTIGSIPVKMMVS